MKKLLLLVAISFLGFALSANAQAKKEKKSKDLHSTAVDKSKGANPNIKNGVPAVDKPVSKSRAETCTINFSNTTGYYVNIYVDGNYMMCVGPYGSGWVNVWNGSYNTIYCVSVGGEREWSDSGNCNYTAQENLYY